MYSEKLVQVFADFARSHNIDRPTVIKILDDVFRSIITKKYGSDEKFDVIINLEKGDLQIWRFRKIVPDDFEPNDGDNVFDIITLSEARKIEPDFEIGEELAEEISIESFGRRAIIFAKQSLLQTVKNLEKDNLYQKYKQLLGEVITAEVYQVLHREIVLWDDDRNELILPKSEQIPNDFFKKGDFIRALVHKVDLESNTPKIVLSRTSPLFLHKLMENEIPEIFDGLINIRKIVRDPGYRAKVAVESYDDRVDPVGACVGIKGSRIYNIVRELRNESIDIINYTDNLELYVSRSLSPAKINKIEEVGDRISVYLNNDQVPLAIGKKGQNIKLASRLIGKEIDIFRDGADPTLNQMDDLIDEFSFDTVEALKRAGFNSFDQIINSSKEDIQKHSGLDIEVINNIYAKLIHLST